MSARVFSVVLVLGSLLSGTGLRAELPLDSVPDKKLRERYRKVALNVVFGHSIRGMVGANGLGWEVYHGAKGEPQRELALALALQALSEATLEMEREALWHWSAAKAVMPTLDTDLLSNYGDIVDLFEDNEYRDQPSAMEFLQGRGELLVPPTEYTPAAVSTKNQIAMPRRKPNAFNGQHVRVSFLVDPEGQVWSPQVEVGGEHSRAVFAILQSLLTWQFEPAIEGGRPGWSRDQAGFSFRQER